jgi:ketosteroid isomerase-like protein
MYRPFGNALVNTSTFPDAASAIRGLTQDFCMGFNTGNYDQVAALYTLDGQFMAPNREPAHGPQAIERVLRELGEAGHQDLRFETILVEQSEDLAVEIGRYTVAIGQGNGTTVVERGKYVHAWRRLGTWQMFADCWSSNRPTAS